MFDSLIDRQPAQPWCEGGKIPWNDPAFSERMLREHLSQEHDQASRRAFLVQEHVAWLHGSILGERASRVLDLGCGPGLYSAALGSLGHSCLGIDFSPRSIDYAESIARQKGLPCEYQLADLTEVELPGDWEAVLMLFGELNTFPRAAAVDLLARAGRALVPGGKIVLELHSEELVRSFGDQPSTWSTSAEGLFADDPHLVLRECSWHEEACASVERYFVYTAAGESSVLAATTQAYSREGYESLLAEAGLEKLGEYPCLTGRDAAVQPGLFVLVAGPA